jgi:hypothetical protein
MPVLDELLPEPHNSVVQDMVFAAGFLHGLDKLRLHTETTLGFADEQTLEYAGLRRTFKDVTCPAFETYELPKEAEARGRRAQRQKAKTPASNTAAPSSVDGGLSAPPPTKKAQLEPGTAKKRKEFNLNTYKYHSIGDYPTVIRRMGTTDNWTTQIVSFIAPY